jgi:hypothetical protein
MDIHLSPHVHDLINLIQNWAVVLYFQPFASIKLDRMSAAFGWTVEEVEHHVVSLIQAGQIQGRVDSQNKASCSNWCFDSAFVMLKLRCSDLESEENRLSCRIIRTCYEGW